MERKFRFGTIGTNFISDTFAEAAELSEAAQVYSVYSRKRETGIAYAERHGVPPERVFTTMEELCASGIDGVYIASPNKFHGEQAEFFLSRGIPALVEKPCASSVTEFDRMCRLSHKNGAVLLEAMRQAHDPMWQAVRDALPMIGRVRHCAFEFCQYSSRYDRHLSGEYTNTFDPSLCNSSLRDIGIYPLYCIVMLFGEPLSVVRDSVFLENGFEANGELLLNYGDFTASALYSKVYDSKRPSAIFGEDGVILIDKLSVPSKITFCRRHGEPVVLAEAEAGGNNMYHEIRTFTTLVRDGLVRHPFEETTRITLRLIGE